RQKTTDSVSHTDFNVDLAVTTNLPPKTGFYITNVTIPISFYTVEAGRNDMTYFIIGANSTSEDVKLCDRRIPEGNYSVVTLNNAIANIMNTGYLSSTVTTVPSKFVSVPDKSEKKKL
ncbi:MAG: hypothetical protein ACKPKO_41915, partial [Candidatus Fonsibacter sp.]